MRIGQRLALRFTLVSAMLTGAILIFIYAVTTGFIHSDFQERLAQQSRIEVLHYATPHVRDVIPPGTFLLENPLTTIYSAAGELLHETGDHRIPPGWVNYLKAHNAFNAKRSAYVTVGRKYDIEGTTYLVFVSDVDVAGEHELEILRKVVLTGWALSFVLSYLAGLYFAGNALEPVKYVVKEVNQINKDNLGHRLSVTKTNLSGPDEIDELVLTFNALLGRIESAFNAQKRFVQNASHELKTPLTAIMAEAELALSKDRSTEQYQRTLQVVIDETERLVHITQGLLTLARLEEGFTVSSAKEHVSLDELIHEAIRSQLQVHGDRGIHFHGVPRQLTVRGDRQLLYVALSNIIDNAIKYSDDEVEVSLKEEGGFAVIEVTDKGIGIPADEMQRVRAPLYRASNARKTTGSGLGLSLVDRIVAVHGGTFDLRSTPSVGTTAVITLPCDKT